MRVAALVLIAGVFMLPTALAAKHETGLSVPLKASDGSDVGTATFSSEPGGKLRVTLLLKNLPSGDHGVHIHEHAVCEAPDFKTAGGHFNPNAKQHGFQNPQGHHAGDLPRNVSIGPDHSGPVTFTLDYLSMRTGAANDILANGGTSIVVHAKPDDMITDPSGNSGNRIACGLISAAPPQ